MIYRKLFNRLTIILFLPILLMVILTPVQESYAPVSMNSTTIGTIDSTIVTQQTLTFDSLAIAGDGFTTRLTPSDELRKYTFDRTASSVSYEILWTDFVTNLVRFEVNEPISDGRVTVSGSVVDNIRVDLADNIQTNVVNFLSAVIIEIIFTFAIPDTGGGAGDPTPIDPDSDGDGIIDSADQCPLVVGTIQNNGCPAPLVQEFDDLPLLDFTIPFEFNELDVVDDFIVLNTESPQPQVESLAIRWLSDEPITITSIDIGDSPFEIQIENIPVSFGDESFGFTQIQIIYTVQEPTKICGNVLAFDCLAEVTYDIPIIVSGESDGKTIIADGSIVIDNSGRVNPFLYTLMLLAIIPVLGLFFWKRRGLRPKTNLKHLLKVTPSRKVKKTLITETSAIKKQKAGTTKKLLVTKGSNVLGKKAK